MSQKLPCDSIAGSHALLEDGAVKDYVTGRENCLQMDYDLVGQSVALTFYWQHPQLGLIKASVDGACSIPESSCSR
ncbi:hypothetical protein V6N13_029956 [Hibiscus sabdariffa]|uniref:Uncharacterized protein n=1 Tax=Hibiscus sabdariffa TaxID=183260 RepID=A0ABR2T993_9ROSI